MKEDLAKDSHFVYSLLEVGPFVDEQETIFPHMNDEKNTILYYYS